MKSSQRKPVGYAIISAITLFAVIVASANADPIVTGNVAYRGVLAGSGLNMNPGQNDGPNVKVYLENSGLTLTSNLAVDRIGPSFGDFTSGTPGTIASGTPVIDYLLHYDAQTANNDVSGTVMFDTPILGLIVFTQNLNSSDSIFAAPTVTYYTGTNRGLDTDAINQGHGDDQFSVTANSFTFNISSWTTTSAVDEVRVILAVPEPGTALAPAIAFGAVIIGCVRKRLGSHRLD
jgi:hypothetical protein